jgi:hypothetical protein
MRALEIKLAKDRIADVMVYILFDFTVIFLLFS